MSNPQIPVLESKSVKTGFLDSRNPLPLVIEPQDGSDKSVDALKNWIAENKEFIDKNIVRYGAILFRGFDVKEPLHFEEVSLLIDKDLKNNYLGTSPRNSITKYVFSASELPGFYPIAQHCEMSFLENVPRKLFFYCHVAPEKDGETPITDFRKVYQQMNPEIRSELIHKKIRYIRNYNGPKTKGVGDLFKLKRWDEMFLTTEHAKVEETCRESKLKFEWRGNDKLVLVNEKNATAKHPVSGENVWFNHLNVFHVDAPEIEYRKINAYRKGLKTNLFGKFITLMTGIKKMMNKPEDQAMHCVFASDGSEIPTAYVEHIEDVIWNNMSVFSWKKGDILAIDNFSTSHGRLPYEGPREIYVCWSAS